MTESAALVPGLHHDVAARNRHDRAVVGHAVLLRRLRHRQLVVARELQLAVDDVEDRVGAPLGLVGRPAAGRRAAAPLVGEDDLRAVVVERGRVPVGEVRVGDRVEPNRVHRVGDVEQDAVALARARREPDLGEGGDVVARVRVRQRAVGGAARVQRPRRVFCRPLNAPVAGSVKIRGWLTTDGRLRRRERHLDDVDAPLRRVARGHRRRWSMSRSRSRRARPTTGRPTVPEL